MGRSWAPGGVWSFLHGDVLFGVMADDLAFGHVDDVFGDVGGEIGDTLHVAADAEEVDQGFQIVRVLADGILDAMSSSEIQRKSRP